MRKHNGVRWQWPCVATSNDATPNCLVSHWNRKRSRNGLSMGLGNVIMSWRDLWPACFLRGSSGKFPEGICMQLLPPVFYPLHLELVVPSTISSCIATSFMMDFQLPYISKTKDQWYAEAVPCCSLLTTCSNSPVSTPRAGAHVMETDVLFSALILSVFVVWKETHKVQSLGRTHLAGSDGRVRLKALLNSVQDHLWYITMRTF